MLKMRMTRERKLARKLGDKDLAAALVAAGLDMPHKIRQASDEDLEAVPGIGKAKRGQIRERIPRGDRGD